MNIVEEGHYYELENLDGSQFNTIKFVNRGHGNDHEGTNNQEVLRVLIDRVSFLDNELPWHGNKEIIMHLRKALILHEARHLERMVDRSIAVDKIPVNETNGHFELNYKNEI